MTGSTIAIAIVALLLGAAIGWLLAGRRQSQQQLAVEQEKQSLNNNLARLTALNESLTSAQAAKDDECRQLRSAGDELRTQLARADEARRNLDERLQTQKAEIEQLQQRLKNEFELLAGKILEANSQRFTQQNRERLDELLGPLRLKLDQFRTRLDEVHTADTKQTAELRTRIEEVQKASLKLASGAESLTAALTGQAKLQGDWGEMILETILDKAGLVLNLHYRTQTSFADEDHRQKRPDVIIDLPDGKHLVVDSKVSLTAYHEYAGATTDDARAAALARHLQSVRSHVDQLSAKKYATLHQINAPEFVLMFVPVEPAFHLATMNDRALIHDAFHKNVVIVTSSTLLATLWTVANIWKQEQQKKNVLKMANEARAICDLIPVLFEDILEVGKRLEQATDAQKHFLQRLKEGRGNLARRAQNLIDLGARADKPPTPEMLGDAELPAAEAKSKPDNGPGA